MNVRRAVAGFALLTLAGCGGGGITEEPTPEVPGPVAAIEITPNPASVLVGSTGQLKAIAKDSKGRTIPGATFTWASDATLLSSVSNTGLVTGVSVGTAIITAIEQSSGARKAISLAVAVPPRPEGSLLVLGDDFVVQYGEKVYVTTLGVADTSSSGMDYRVGIVHAELSNISLNPPISRSAFPQFSAVVECPDSKVYATSYENSEEGVSLWRVDPKTAVATRIIRSFYYGLDTIRSLACDGSSSLLVAGYMLTGDLYRLDLGSGKLYVIRSLSTDVILSMARSPEGTLYATAFDYYDYFSSDRSQPQLLVTVNLANGVQTPVGVGQPQRFPRVTRLAFRGNRLLGISVSNLVEMNTQTGAASIIRPVKIP